MISYVKQICGIDIAICPPSYRLRMIAYYLNVTDIIIPKTCGFRPTFENSLLYFSDFYDAYSENCRGIYAAGSSIDEAKADTLEAIRLIKKTLPEDRWPEPLKGEYELLFRLDTQSFLQYYKDYLSLAGLEKITGVKQKQLSNYLNSRSKPRKTQRDRINKGLHDFATELLSMSI